MPYSGFSLEGKTAVVVGGTSGIGNSISLGFAESGANVVPTGRRPEEVSKTAAEVRSRGAKSLEVPCDATRRESIQQLIDQTVAEFGRIDILVNSAGTTKRMPSVDFPDEEWHRILNVNMNATWYACQMVGRVMKEQGAGKIINIASIASFVAFHEVTAYCTSKGAVAQMTRTLGCEWAKHGINVNGIAPGVFETPMNSALINQPERKQKILSRTPMSRFGNLKELQGAAIFLASEASNYVAGEILAVDGGFLAQGI